MITVMDLRKSFATPSGPVHALRGVSFVARDGQITGLLGPNGAGKTTTLRVLYTLLAPDGGTAAIDGFDVQSDPLEAQRRIGALPDVRGLYARLTARENVRYYGRLQGLRGEELEQQIESLVDSLDMGEFIDRRVEGFSGGQRLKVAIARALVHGPGNILLDEPTSGLDVMSTRALRDIIRRLRDEGKCVLFSSHVMQEVALLCDEIVIVDHGQVVASGTADGLREDTGEDDLEDAFVHIIGSEEGLVR